MRVVLGIALVALGAAMSVAGAFAQEAERDGAAGVQSWAVAAASEGPEAGWERAKEEALNAVERLREDVRLLRALLVLQTRLLDWNGGLAESGAGLVSLDGSLCEEAEVRVWCELLPATFGGLEEDG